MSREPDEGGLPRRARAWRDRLWALATEPDAQPRWLRGLSLADKTQALFGAALLLILLLTLIVPWVRMGAVVDASQFQTSKQLAALWGRAGLASEGARPAPRPDGDDAVVEQAQALDSGAHVEFIPAARLGARGAGNAFLASAHRRMADPNQPTSEKRDARWFGGTRVYRHAEAIRDGASGALRGVVYVERSSPQAATLLLVNRGYVILAGLGAGSLAVVVFHLITTRIILSPVRRLRRTADAVRAGDMTIRASIRTGDEFEELAEAFNSMLASIEAAQEQLRASNRVLDLRVHELAEANVSLHEANRVKSEFLANISHELRTPLNSIIGFAELLASILDDEERAGEPSPERRAQIVKRRRYLENIITAGRNLLEMINELLDMAKIEAGRLELHLESIDAAETCRSLLALIRPQAERKGLELRLEVVEPARGPPDGEPERATTFASALDDAVRAGGEARATLPPLVTDARKFQQVIFNFLSNAVKFTPDGGRVTLRAERLAPADGEARIRVSVLDTGPGIPEEHHRSIFEKFRQLDSGPTRAAGGTGLGLAIAKELASALGGEIQLVSAPGAGSMFSLIVPIEPRAGGGAKRERPAAHARAFL